MDLNKIANSGGFGSGAKVIDEQRERDERLASLPNPMLMAEIYARTEMGGYSIAPLGYCSDTDADWFLEHESELGLVDGEDNTAATDARLIAAVWNAYRDGLLVVGGKND
jgi:hypothetical protein